jgi:hypothetical protein
MSDDEYAGLSVEERLRFARLGLQFSVADAATAIEAKTFTRRHDHYLTRLPLTVDEAGWKELNEIYAEALQRTVEVEAASADRMSKDPESNGIPARVISMFFEMPPREEG